MSTPTREEFLASITTPASPSPANTTCSICREDYGTTTTHTAVTFSGPTSCNHIFGRECIVTWLNTHGVNTCPYCRRELFALSLEDEDVNSGYGSVHDDDSEISESTDEDDEEQHGGREKDEEQVEEQDDTIPLSYLYRDHYTLPLDVLIPLLKTTWYKTWNLLQPYTSEMQVASKHGAPPPDPRSFDRYLPTTPVLLASFANSVAARAGCDICGVLDEGKTRILEVLLKDMLDMQKGFVGGCGVGSGRFARDVVPLFPRTGVPLWGWVVSVKEAVGIVAVVSMARGGR